MASIDEAIKAESPLNWRVINALDGNHSNPAVPLIELLRSDVEIWPEVRERIAIALERTDADCPQLAFSGGIGMKSPPAQVQVRRNWLDLAERFHSTGLSQPDFLDAEPEPGAWRRRTYLQSAIAYYREFVAWVESGPNDLRDGPDVDADAADRNHFAKMRFAELTVYGED